MRETAPFISTHKLAFMSTYWDNAFNLDCWQKFKVGTCHGLWLATEGTYDILSVINDKPGNGHFDDLLEWFEQSCRRDHKSLRMLEVFNPELLRHLIDKRGFIRITEENLIKRF